MINYNEIHLSDLSSSLQNTHVKLGLEFLDKLLKNASKNKPPATNKKFVRRIGGIFNEKAGRYTTIGGWLKGHRTVPFSKLIKIMDLSSYQWRDVEKNLISIKAGIRSGEIYPRFPITIDEKVGSIVGHILGDGSIGKRYLQPFYTNSNIELIREFIGNMEEVFGIKPRIWVQRCDFKTKSKWIKRIYDCRDIPKNSQIGLFYPKICGMVLHEISGKFANGKNKCITHQIKNSNTAFKIGLLRAFFDDEGSINSSSHTIRIFQNKMDILEDIKSMLSELNIKSNPIRNYLKMNKVRYLFNITGFNSYNSFYKLIGCTSSKKRREFELLIDKVKNSRKLKNNLLA